MDSTGEIRLEALVAKYLTNKCEFDTFPQQLRQTQFKVCVFEFLPEFWVSDSSHYMEAVFTREAYHDFKKLHAGQKLCKLKDKMILIKRWGLVAKEVDSEEVFTSFLNVKVQLVIEQFQPLLHENSNQVQIKKIENLFEESKEVREIIKSIKHAHYLQTLKKMPKSLSLNLNASKVQNTVDLNQEPYRKQAYDEPTADTDSDDSKGLRAYLEKDLKTYKSVEIYSLLQQESKQELINDAKEKGQVWIYEQIAKAKDREGTKQALDFIQVHKASSEIKDSLAKKKKKEIRNKKNGADLEMVQIEKVAKKQVLTEDDILQGRTAPLPKKDQPKPVHTEKKAQTPQKNLEYNYQKMKDNLLRILNPKSGNRPSHIEDQQRKTYSTEDLMQGRVVPFLNLGKKDPRQEAMSQMIAYNRLDEDEEQTETEKDEDEEMLEQRRLGVLTNFKMNIYMFQKFIKWQRQHQVSKHPILEYHNNKKQEEEPAVNVSKEEQMEIEKQEEEQIKKDFEEEEEEDVMDQVERIQTEQEEDDEEEDLPVRRSSRIRKPVISPKQEQDVEMEMEDEEEASPPRKDRDEPRAKGFQTFLGEDEDDDSSKQLDEAYQSPYSEGDPGEKVELEDLNDQINREKLEIEQLVRPKPSTKKMLESSEEDVSSVKNSRISPASKTNFKEEVSQSAQKKTQLLDFEEKQEHIPSSESEEAESLKSFKQSPKKFSPKKFSPKRISPVKTSPKKVSPAKISPKQYFEEEQESEEEVIPKVKTSSIKKQRKLFEDDSSEEEEVNQKQQSIEKKEQSLKNLETPKNTLTTAMYEENQEERGTTATNNLKNSIQSSQEEETGASQKHLQKQKFEELINSSQNQEKQRLPSPIAMKNSAIKAPSDFASLNFGQEQKPAVNLGEKRTGYEIDNKQASKLQFEDSEEEEEKLPLKSSRKSSQDDLDVIVPEGNDGEMSPTYSIAPDPEVKEVAAEMKEQFAVKGPLFQGNTERNLEDSASKHIPSFGAGTPEWHRSCENSERMSDKSGATLNQLSMTEKMRKLEEENKNLKNIMMIQQTEDYNRKRDSDRKEEKRRRKEAKQKKRELKAQMKNLEKEEKFQSEKKRMKEQMLQALRKK